MRWKQHNLPELCGNQLAPRRCPTKYPFLLFPARQNADFWAVRHVWRGSNYSQLALPVNGDCFDSHLAASEDDSTGYFASICDEDFVKRRFICVDRVGEIKGFVVRPRPRCCRRRAHTDAAIEEAELLCRRRPRTPIADERMEGS